MKKKCLILISFIIGVFLFVNLVSAAKQVPEFPEGFTLRVPQVETFKRNSPANSRMHVFNTSTGMPIISGITCYWHLYNETGDHITTGFDSEVGGEGFDYEFEIAGANFSVLGQYSFIIQCNSSTEGGFVAGSFEVTPSGRALETSESLIYIIALFASILIFVAMLYGAIRIPYKNNKSSENKTISINYLKHIKVMLCFFSYIILLWVLNLMVLITTNYLDSNVAFRFFNIIYIILINAFYPLILLVLMITVVNIVNDNKTRKMLARGIFQT